MQRGFSLLEILFVITIISLLFLIIPGLDQKSVFKIANQNDVQSLVDHLRLAQRRAVLAGVDQYLSIIPENQEYQIYELRESGVKVHHQVKLKDFKTITINRSVSGMDNTFYFTPRGTPVFGCTITLEDGLNLWNVIISVASGKIRIEKE